MKKNTYPPARTYQSAVLNEFLSLGTPEELARTESRMMLAAKIHDAMTAKGIGKKQLAGMLAQSPSVITKWLSGGHNFTVDTLTDIQRVLGIRLLAVDEKPVVENVYLITAKITLAVPETIPHPMAGGRVYSTPTALTDKVRTTTSNLQRNLPCA